jgi:hypothetical protein
MAHDDEVVLRTNTLSSASNYDVGTTTGVKIDYSLQSRPGTGDW